MRKNILSFIFVAICPLLIAQQTLNNDFIIKLVKAGLSEDLIVTTINGSAGNYDTSADGIIALKAAGVSDNEVKAMVNKAAVVTKTALAAKAPMPPVQTATPSVIHPAKDTGPFLRLGFCSFELDGSAPPEVSGPYIGLMGLATIEGNIHNELQAIKYFSQITPEVQSIYEPIVMRQSGYRVVELKHLNDLQHGKQFSMQEIITRYNLSICVNAKSYWTAYTVKKKDIEAAILTQWRVVGLGGCGFDFMTAVTSNENYKKVPVGSNPKLHSAYTGLSQDDAAMFVTRLEEGMKKTGCGHPVIEH